MDKLLALYVKIHNGDQSKAYTCGSCKRLIHAPKYLVIKTVVILTCPKCELKQREPSAPFVR